MTNPCCSWCGLPSHEPAINELITCPRCGTHGITCDEWQEESRRQYAEAAERVMDQMNPHAFLLSWPRLGDS